MTAKAKLSSSLLAQRKARGLTEQARVRPARATTVRLGSAIGGIGVAAILGAVVLMNASAPTNEATRTLNSPLLSQNAPQPTQTHGPTPELMSIAPATVTNSELMVAPAPPAITALAAPPAPAPIPTSTAIPPLTTSPASAAAPVPPVSSGPPVPAAPAAVSNNLPAASAAAISSIPEPVTGSVSALREQQSTDTRPAATVPLSKEEASALRARGDALFGNRDIVSARLFYQRAAEGGDGQSALQLGETYDPAFLKRAGIAASRGDSVIAKRWYQQAALLGTNEAQILLQRNTTVASVQDPGQLRTVFSRFIDERRQANGAAAMTDADKSALFEQFQASQKK